MIKYKIKAGDPVVVIAGKNRYASNQNTKLKGAKVKSIDRKNGKVLVEGANLVKRHLKSNQLHPDGGIYEKEMPIDVSNVMYLCPKCDKGVRLGIKKLDDGRKVRFCRNCNEIIDKG
jgi:large subunit ribosomal protein L24